MKKHVSIIIPYRNTYEYLVKLLDSIGNRQEVDIIVIDDQSDKFVEEYQTLTKNPNYSHVQFLKNNSNKRSAGIGRNIGLKHAKGSWILFADADDYFLENYFDAISKYFDSDYDVVFFPPTSLNRDTGEKTQRHTHFIDKLEAYQQDSKKYINEINLRYKLYVPWSKLIRKDFIDKHKLYFDDVFVKNDSLFSVSVGYYMEKFAISDQIIYCVTSHSQGHLTYRNDDLFVEESTKSRIHLLAFLDEHLGEKEKKIIEFYELPFYHIELLKQNNVSEQNLNKAQTMFIEAGYKVETFKSKIVKLVRWIKGNRN